jgi:glyoxylase-like metal-dependent hydrolase (beta-lactamase superfamily II)
MGAVFTVGAIECRLITDGWAKPPADLVFATAPPAERTAALAEELAEDGSLDAPYQALLLTIGGEPVLVDGGNGSFPHIFPCDAGQLVAELSAEGIEPGDVELVIVTHGHTDHSGGLVQDGRPVFEKARHVLSRTEWEFWDGDGPERTGVSELMTGGTRQALRLLMEAGLIDLVEPGVEPVPGVRLLAAPGHTPGQVVVEVRSQGDAALFLADVVLHPVQAEHPDWCMSIELGAEREVESTRRRLLGQAAEEGIRVAASHLLGPMTVEAAGAGFRLTPA